MPLVSIITSTFNRAGVIGRAIESVLTQEFPDWEMNIVGDCTPDNTAEVVAAFGDPRLHFHNLSEKSPPRAHGAIAKNHAIQKMSSGKYIAYLDDDDGYRPDYLSVMIGYLESHGDAQLVYCRCLYRDKDTGRRILGNPFQRWMHGYSREKLKQYNFIDTDCVVHRKALLDEVGGWNPGYYFDDYELWLRISERYDLHYINRVLVEKYVDEPPFLVRLFSRGLNILRFGRHNPPGVMMIRQTTRWFLLFVLVLSSLAFCFEVRHLIRDYVGPLFKGSTDFVDDFQFFYEGACRVLQSPDLLYEGNTAHGFLFIESGARCDYGYPPPAVLFFLPLAFLPLRWAFPVFILCSILLTVLNVRLIRGLLNGEEGAGRNGGFWGIITVTVLSLGPVYVTLAFGQVNALVLMFSLGYIWAVKKERFLTAGVLMGLGFWLKFYPLFLLVLAPLEKRPVRLLLASLVSIAALPVLLSPVLPLHLYFHYFQTIYPGLADQTAPHVYNQSWIGLFTRLSGSKETFFSWGPILIDPEVKTINSLLQVVLFGWIAWGYCRKRTRKLFYYACVMTATPMVVTYGWGGTYMLAIPLLLLAWVGLIKSGGWGRAGFLLLWGLFTIPAYRPLDLVAWRGGVVEQVYYSRYLIASLVLLLTMIYHDAFGRKIVREESRS